MVGIYRQILLMLNKGIELSTVSQAVQNYAADPFAKGLPEQNRFGIRKFMMPERIRQWAGMTNTKSATLSALEKLTEQSIAQQFKLPETPVWKPEPEAEEEPCPQEL
jgi:uncharacterized protein VirK/YbjX